MGWYSIIAVCLNLLHLGGGQLPCWYVIASDPANCSINALHGDTLRCGNLDQIFVRPFYRYFLRRWLYLLPNSIGPALRPFNDTRIDNRLKLRASILPPDSLDVIT